jgi:hypothetical protein
MKMNIEIASPIHQTYNCSNRVIAGGGEVDEGTESRGDKFNDVLSAALFIYDDGRRNIMAITNGELDKMRKHAVLTFLKMLLQYSHGGHEGAMYR